MSEQVTGQGHARLGGAPLVELKCDCGWYMLVPPGTEGIDCGGPECEGGRRDPKFPCPLGMKVGIKTHLTGVAELRGFKARVAKLLKVVEFYEYDGYRTCPSCNHRKYDRNPKHHDAECKDRDCEETQDCALAALLLEAEGA